jgi:ribonuclease HI
MFKASLKFGYIPTSWRGTYVTFIPKEGKTSYDKAKSFRPISLMSFILKVLEKLIDRNIRDKALGSKPIDKDQHAYQTGKDTNSAIHQLVTKIERTLANDGTSLTIFLDISGAFDNTEFSTIELAAREHGAKEWEINWIHSMLKNRIVKSKIDDNNIGYMPTRGCPQGGCLSPLLWCLVADPLIIRLKRAGFHVVAYADDFAITITSNNKLQSTLPDKMNEAMRIVETWCHETKLSVNPEKTFLMRHTRKGRNCKLKHVKLNGKVIAEVEEFKYLGVIIDNKLSWTSHIKHIIEKSRKSLWATRAMVAKSWGISPKIMMWVYKQIILPRITYGSVVWWHKAKIKKYSSKLDSLQRAALMMVTGAMRSTPTKSLNVLMNVNSLEMQIQSTAMKTCARLRWNGSWISQGNQLEHREISKFLDLITGNISCDKTEIRWNTNYKYDTIINERNTWNRGLYIENNPNCWYSDGSKKDDKVAFGIYNPIKDVVFEARISDSGTIMQAEMKGIQECAKRMSQEGNQGGRALILSDSQAAIKALRNVKIFTDTTWECAQELNKLSEAMKVTVAWVPGHSNVLGNEVADRLANQGIEHEYIDVEVPIAERLMENKIDEWFESKKRMDWERDKQKLAHSMNFIRGFDKKLSEKLLNFKRNDLRVCIAMWSGHGCIKDFLFKIRKADNTNCSFCEEEDDETMEHLLCFCPALMRIGMSAPSTRYSTTRYFDRIIEYRVLGHVDFEF